MPPELLPLGIPTATVEFRAVLTRHVSDLERRYPERYSVAWFFLRYLKRVHKKAFSDPSPKVCSGAIRGLTRFYVDQIDDGSELAWRFEEILEAHRTALRHAQSS